MPAKILFLDIETSKMLVSTFRIGEQRIRHQQVKEDWQIIAWCAKWMGKPAIYYQDLRGKLDQGDRAILNKIWQLMDEADIIVAQNGARFDIKRLNARFAIHDMLPPSPYKVIDTLKITNKFFDLTSHSLDYLTQKFCKKYKKSKHKKFPGDELWDECALDNREAWREMEKYNKLDVLSLEELYERLKPWGLGVDLGLYEEDDAIRCPSCASDETQFRGYAYTLSGKYRRFACLKCGHWARTPASVHTSKQRKI